MRDFVIVTDSCCDLPEEYIKNNNIPYVPLTYRFKGREYLDDFGASLNYKEFYQGMKSGEIPQTSQANPDAFYKVFEEILREGKDIIYVGVSSGLSGTHNSSNIAKEMLEDEYKDAKIAIIDVLTASLGQGLMVIKAMEMRKKGDSFEKIVNYLEENKMNLNTYITVNDLNHLKRGGRISSAAALFGTVLHIKPVLTLNNEGRVIPVIKVKGRKNAIGKLAEFVHNKLENSEEQIITICHGDAQSEAERLKELILKEFKVKEVIINHIGPVVGTFGGPGALAVFFIGKHRQNHVIDIDI
ncbi:DegV family protein [Clostridium sp. KNHs214]|uniref:DegV family protein n=1 Tax=Clostridium sp. KNHs214 TaxID=1540257 RepID=UPI0005578653|nr:DegV family protein [Clostridium sp. KNHs214]